VARTAHQVDPLLYAELFRLRRRLRHPAAESAGTDVRKNTAYPDGAMRPGQDRRHAMNEHRRRLFGDAGRPLALLCECDSADCHETILLTVEEYDGIRPGRILHPLHAPVADGSNR